ncbi:ABC-type transport system involved in multi-copper enzyme maturation permease subunit [Glaciihabitans tibetensis]|uniref:ABC-type transport system involved in multi-copper enzyme maturation permease subunit n=1 Tax=Glaciihabitans tibetensis TaxID=1266600 RepID=A0A2T0V4C8_9MICO|nr:ABC transporter permease [Glaciihabitans tibetensis]PRY65035.1 ABC-type transport system involved in multi-copper enzyme maturation permease subunit [Glaciihabitans tibetensis]
MNAFLSGTQVILSLELRQRVRGTAWYVLLGIFVVLVAIVTILLSIALTGFGVMGSGDAGGNIYSAIIYFVLLLGTLVAPALSGNAINGDRDAGTLATTQVTLVTTGQIVVGKFLAAWITALAFLAASVPFLIYAWLVGGLSVTSIVVSIVVLAIELGIVAAIGVGLSGIITRPLISIVATYLAVATLSVGTLIAFSLGGFAVQSTVVSTSSYGMTYSDSGEPLGCSPATTSTYETPRFDYLWGILVANPYVVLADAVPTSYDQAGNPQDLFGYIKYGVRTAQVTPDLTVEYDECTEGVGGYMDQGPTAQETIDSTVPGWFVGLAIQTLLGAGALVGAWARTRTPAGKLPTGSRIA